MHHSFESASERLPRKPLLASVGKQDSLSSETSTGRNDMVMNVLRANKSDSEHCLATDDEPGPTVIRGKRVVAGGPVIAPELSDLVIYCQVPIYPPTPMCHQILELTLFVCAGYKV